MVGLAWLLQLHADKMKKGGDLDRSYDREDFDDGEEVFEDKNDQMKKR